MPRAAAIVRLEEPAAGAIEFVVIFPWPFAHFPHGGVNHVRIRGVDLNVGAAGVFIFGNDALPVLSAIGGTVDTALLARAIGMTQHCREDFIRITRIDGECGNLLAISQAGQVCPCFAGVRGFVNTVARRKVRALQSFPAADIDHIRIRRRNGDGADRPRRLVIENRVPRATVIVRLPHSAVHLPHVKHAGLAGHAGGSAGASAAKWADHPPV